MNCDEVHDDLADYDLWEDPRFLSIREHLGVCPDCARAREEVSRVRRFLAPEPDRAPQAPTGAIDLARHGRRTGRLVAAAALVAVALGAFAAGGWSARLAEPHVATPPDVAAGAAEIERITPEPPEQAPPAPRVLVVDVEDLARRGLVPYLVGVRKVLEACARAADEPRAALAARESVVASRLYEIGEILRTSLDGKEHAAIRAVVESSQIVLVWIRNVDLSDASNRARIAEEIRSARLLESLDILVTRSPAPRQT